MNNSVALNMPSYVSLVDCDMWLDIIVFTGCVAMVNDFIIAAQNPLYPFHVDGRVCEYFLLSSTYICPQLSNIHTCVIHDIKYSINRVKI